MLRTHRPTHAISRAKNAGLGCVLHRMCTGTMAFPGEDLRSMLLALETEQPAPPQQLNPNVPMLLNDLILGLLAKERDDRPASAEMVVQRLQAIESRFTGTNTGQGPPTGEFRSLASLDPTLALTPGKSSSVTRPLPAPVPGPSRPMSGQTTTADVANTCLCGRQSHPAARHVW
jgi:hypothetical protein